ncbi:Protein of unknown function DUF1645, plant [Dillenia turbinata]|uniref:Uncharacterized protein n=1 Tax=Dillenia turbinata TaxID=194707 RepID=A0AAN8Z4A7_9MAGN
MEDGTVLSVSPPFSEIAGEFAEDFERKLSFNNASKEDEQFEEEEEDDDEIKEEYKDGDEDGEEDEDEEEEFEFSFATCSSESFPISADEIFQDGQIRPIFPLFDQNLLFETESESSNSSLRPPLKKIFITETDPLPPLPPPPPPSCSSSSSASISGPGYSSASYYNWSGKAVEESPEICKKSNSTGFSRRWRFRDLLHRSSSDGKDAFVFLKQPSSSAPPAPAPAPAPAPPPKIETSDKERRKSFSSDKTSGKSKTKPPSAHEAHYMRNKAKKEGDRRKSYLPYRQSLVGIGFFTNVNGLSRNVHPF